MSVLSTLPIVVGVALPIGIAGYMVRVRLQRNRESLTEKLTGLHFSNEQISDILRLIPAKQRYEALIAILASREKQIVMALDEVDVGPVPASAIDGLPGAFGRAGEAPGATHAAPAPGAPAPAAPAPGAPAPAAPAPGAPVPGAFALPDTLRKPAGSAPLGDVQQLLGAIERDERLTTLTKRAVLGAPVWAVLLYSAVELANLGPGGSPGDPPPLVARTADVDAALTTSTPPVVTPPVDTPPPPLDYPELVASAARLVEAGDCTSAIPLFERARALRPDAAEAQSGLGHCYLESEDYARAEASFNAVLASAPRDDDALLGLAETYRLQGQKSRALAAYNRYLALHPHGDKAALAKRHVRDLRKAATAAKPPPAEERKAVDVGF